MALVAVIVHPSAVLAVAVAAVALVAVAAPIAVVAAAVWVEEDNID